MTNTQHIPGPWALGRRKESWIGINAPRWTCFARVVVRCEGYPDTQADLQGEANARLIAAAPDLLEALEGIMFQNSDISEQEMVVRYVKARAAIAKARGDTETGHH
jgi:hypothetical protein